MTQNLPRPEDEELAIVTGGRRLAGWTAVNVFRSVERGSYDDAMAAQ